MSKALDVLKNILGAILLLSFIQVWRLWVMVVAISFVFVMVALGYSIAVVLWDVIVSGGI